MPALTFKHTYLSDHVVLDFTNSLMKCGFSCYKQICGKNCNDSFVRDFLSANGIYTLNGLNLITPKIYAHSVVRIREKYVNGVSFYSESAAFKIKFRTIVKNIDKSE